MTDAELYAQLLAEARAKYGLAPAPAPAPMLAPAPQKPTGARAPRRARIAPLGTPGIDPPRPAPIGMLGAPQGPSPDSLLESPNSDPAAALRERGFVRINDPREAKRRIVRTWEPVSITRTPTEAEDAARAAAASPPVQHKRGRGKRTEASAQPSYPPIPVRARRFTRGNTPVPRRPDKPRIKARAPEGLDEAKAEYDAWMAANKAVPGKVQRGIRVGRKPTLSRREWVAINDDYPKALTDPEPYPDEGSGLRRRGLNSFAGSRRDSARRLADGLKKTESAGR